MSGGRKFHCMSQQSLTNREAPQKSPSVPPTPFVSVSVMILWARMLSRHGMEGDSSSTRKEKKTVPTFYDRTQISALTSKLQHGSDGCQRATEGCKCDTTWHRTNERWKLAAELRSRRRKVASHATSEFLFSDACA